MTTNDLNQLFASAREIPVETAPEQVAGWVGTAAATSTGVLGLAGKLKLLIAKKTFIMMGTILSVASLGVIVTMSWSTSKSPKPAEPKNESLALVTVSNSGQERTENTVLAEDTLTALQPEPPQKPPQPPKAIAPISPITPRAVTIPPRLPKAPEAMEVLKSQPEDDRREKSHVAPNADGEYIVDDFTIINMSGVADLVLIQGNECKVKFDVNPDMLEGFRLNSSGGILNIDFNDDVFAKNMGETVYITFKTLDEIKLSGVGDIKSDGVIKLNNLVCTVYGIGDINLDIDCDHLDVQFSGVGDVDMKGTVKSAKYAWSGVGDLNAKGLKSEEVSLTLSGIGDAKLHATETLEVNLTGFGDVKYTGSPKTTDFSNPGSGKIKGS